MGVKINAPLTVPIPAVPEFVCNDCAPAAQIPKNITSENKIFFIQKKRRQSVANHSFYNERSKGNRLYGELTRVVINSKSPAPNSREISNTKSHSSRRVWSLDPEASLEFGAWNLENARLTAF